MFTWDLRIKLGVWGAGGVTLTRCVQGSAEDGSGLQKNWEEEEALEAPWKSLQYKRVGTLMVAGGRHECKGGIYFNELCLAILNKFTAKFDNLKYLTLFVLN